MINLPASNRQPNKIVFMEDITSNEFYLHGEADFTPVLQKIDLTVLKGQILGVTGKSLFEMKLLLEIIANIRSYNTGRCVLFERGMMRRKRVILPHIFYIGNQNMVYNNMNVLEFLMFSLMKHPKNKVVLQEEMLDYLMQIGLQEVALTPISTLPKEYKAVILLLSSAYSYSDLIVFNFPDYTFDEFLINAIANITSLISQREKTLILASHDGDVIEKACSHIAILVNGKIVFHGSTTEFRYTYDRIILTIWDQDAEDMAILLRVFLPQYEYTVDGKALLVKDFALPAENPRMLYQKITEFNLVPEKVKLNAKTVKNACEEILRQYDIH